VKFQITVLLDPLSRTSLYGCDKQFRAEEFAMYLVTRISLAILGVSTFTALVIGLTTVLSGLSGVTDGPGGCCPS
jgi:hypothetical protein